MKIADNVKRKKALKNEHSYWCPAHKLCNWELPQEAISRENLTWGGQNLCILKASEHGSLQCGLEVSKHPVTL
jgi:hypothetical protein